MSHRTDENDSPDDIESKVDRPNVCDFPDTGNCHQLEQPGRYLADLDANQGNASRGQFLQHYNSAPYPCDGHLAETRRPPSGSRAEISKFDKHWPTDVNKEQLDQGATLNSVRRKLVFDCETPNVREKSTYYDTSGETKLIVDHRPLRRRSFSSSAIPYDHTQRRFQKPTTLVQLLANCTLFIVPDNGFRDPTHDTILDCVRELLKHRRICSCLEYLNKGGLQSDGFVVSVCRLAPEHLPPFELLVQRFNQDYYSLGNAVCIDTHNVLSSDVPSSNQIGYDFDPVLHLEWVRNICSVPDVSSRRRTLYRLSLVWSLLYLVMSSLVNIVFYCVPISLTLILGTLLLYRDQTFDVINIARNTLTTTSQWWSNNSTVNKR